MVADLCIKHDVLCISDEVYEWLIYPGAELVRIGKPIFALVCDLMLQFFLHS